MALCLDTHCHLDADEFGLDRDAIIARAAQSGVSGVLLPAVRAKDHLSVKNLAHHAAQLMPASCYTFWAAWIMPVKVKLFWQGNPWLISLSLI